MFLSYESFLIFKKKLSLLSLRQFLKFIVLFLLQVFLFLSKIKHFVDWIKCFTMNSCYLPELFSYGKSSFSFSLKSALLKLVKIKKKTEWQWMNEWMNLSQFGNLQTFYRLLSYTHMNCPLERDYSSFQKYFFFFKLLFKSSSQQKSQLFFLLIDSFVN